MIKREWDLLFYEYDLRGVLENQKLEAMKRIREIQASRLLSDDLDTMADELVKSLSIAPISLHEGDITIDQREVEIDVSHDFNRASWGDGPTYVRGLEVTYYVPYSGDRELLKCRPGSFNMNPPRAVIQDHDLTFPYDSPDREVAGTKRNFEEDVRAIKMWLGWQSQDIETFNRELPAVIKAELTTRRQTLARSQEEMGSLGYKVRPKPTPSITPPAPAPARSAKPSKAAPDKYDVALSFAGEDRTYVAAVAAVLIAQGVNIFYDDYEEVGLWGKNLADHLGEVYSNKSRFVVMFLSKHYAAKAWPTFERQQAQSKAIKQRTEYILPARFDDTEIPGMPNTIAYLDLRKLTPEQLAERIIKKLGK